MYPILCEVVKKHSKPILTDKILRRSLFSDSWPYVRHPFLYHHIRLTKNKAVLDFVRNSVLNSPKLLSQTFNEVNRLFLGDWGQFPDRPYSVFFPLKNLTSEEDRIVSVKPNSKREVAAVVFSDVHGGRSFGVYAYGKGKERRTTGQVLYFSESLERKPEYLNLSWSPSGNILLVLEYKEISLSFASVILLSFEGEEGVTLRKIRLNEEILFGPVTFCGNSDVGTCDLWISEQEYLFPCYESKRMTKLEVEIVRDNRAKVTLTQLNRGSTPARVYPKSSEQSRKCGRPKEKAVGFTPLWNYGYYQPLGYWLVNRNTIATIENCPVSEHLPHSSVTFTNVETGQSKIWSFKFHRVHDFARDSKGNFLVLLTSPRNLASEKVEIVKQVPPLDDECKVGVKKPKDLSDPDVAAEKVLLSRVELDWSDADGSRDKIENVCSDNLLLKIFYGHPLKLTIFSNTASFVGVSACCTRNSNDSVYVKTAFLLSKVFPNVRINLRNSLFLYHPCKDLLFSFDRTFPTTFGGWNSNAVFVSKTFDRRIRYGNDDGNDDDDDDDNDDDGENVFECNSRRTLRELETYNDPMPCMVIKLT